MLNCSFSLKKKGLWVFEFHSEAHAALEQQAEQGGGAVIYLVCYERWRAGNSQEEVQAGSRRPHRPRGGKKGLNPEVPAGDGSEHGAGEVFYLLILRLMKPLWRRPAHLFLTAEQSPD